jgi:hypothetical protein
MRPGLIGMRLALPALSTGAGHHFLRQFTAMAIADTTNTAIATSGQMLIVIMRANRTARHDGGPSAQVKMSF